MSDGELVTLSDSPTLDEKANAATKLKLNGYSWDDIAKACGFKNGNSARMQVKVWMQKAIISRGEEYKAEAIDLELARLDELQKAVWPAAMAGDTKAVDSVLRVMNHRAKLLGLEEADTKVTNQTVVVSGNTQDFVQTLKVIAGEAM